MGNNKPEQECKEYVFKNLIEASSTKNLGGMIESECAVPFSNKNAVGNLGEMSFQQAGARGKAFGRRFKKMAMVK